MPPGCHAFLDARSSPVQIPRAGPNLCIGDGRIQDSPLRQFIFGRGDPCDRPLWPMAGVFVKAYVSFGPPSDDIAQQIVG